MNIIRPLPILKLTLEKSLMTYRMNFGQPQDVYPTMWFIEGPKEKIIVDTGCDAKTANQLGFPSEQIAYPDDALAKIGLKPSDIDILILTHMHFDHVEFARIFGNAKVIVQKSEYDFAMNPHPFFAIGYVRELFKDLKKLEIIEGDVDITDGVKVLYTPGHTPGGQSIAVTTDKGTAVVCGLCALEDNLAPPEDVANVFPVIPPGIHTDVMQAYDSLTLIKEVADIAIPIHDATFCFKEKIPW